MPKTTHKGKFEHLNHVHDIAQEDADGVEVGDVQYGASWKKRGGVGCFMMLARKWDRLEQRVEQYPLHDNPNPAEPSGMGRIAGDKYDIFDHVKTDERAEGIIDDIRDMRRYLLLLEAHCRAAGMTSAMSQHRDNRDDAV